VFAALGNIVWSASLPGVLTGSQIPHFCGPAGISYGAAIDAWQAAALIASGGGLFAEDEGALVAESFGRGAEGGAGASSTYVDLTKGGSVLNIGTDATNTEFSQTLSSSGWTVRSSADGAVQIFEKDGARYVLRSNAGSYSGWTADYYPAGSSNITLKLRLGYTP
jgi:hypothetical protein